MASRILLIVCPLNRDFGDTTVGIVFVIDCRAIGGSGLGELRGRGVVGVAGSFSADGLAQNISSRVVRENAFFDNRGSAGMQFFITAGKLV